MSGSALNYPVRSLSSPREESVNIALFLPLVTNILLSLRLITSITDADNERGTKEFQDIVHKNTGRMKEPYDDDGRLGGTEPLYPPRYTITHINDPGAGKENNGK